MHLISQKLPSLRGLINPVRSNFYAVGQKQSHWLAVKSYSPNPQPQIHLPHHCLENELSYAKLFSETQTHSTHSGALGRGRERGVMGRDERSWSPKIWWQSCSTLTQRQWDTWQGAFRKLQGTQTQGTPSGFSFQCIVVFKKSWQASAYNSQILSFTPVNPPWS